MARPKTNSITRFWNKVDKRSEDECWNYMAGIDKDGYGQFWDSNTNKQTRAHRYSAEIHLGKEDGMCVCHTCDNPLCVNPKHLFYGTSLDNQNDKVSKNRHAKGETQGHSKLTNNQIDAIRSRMNESYKELCQEFNVVPSTIYRIWRHNTWKHI
jgi:hypothetical protein